MGVFTEQAVWEDGIFQLELTSPAMGGPDGPLNTAAKQLANRSRFLKKFADEVAAAREGEASLQARINKRGVEPQNILSRYQYLADAPVAVSTGNVDVATGGTQAIDGIACAIGDLVLLKDQTDPRQNGCWEVQSGAWNRYAGYTAEDADCLTYKFIHAKEGEANAGKLFVLDTDSYEIGVDNLMFVESLFSPRKIPGKAVIRDEDGNTEEFDALPGDTPDGWGLVSDGRNLLDVLGVNTIADAIEMLHGKINADGVPDFSGLQIGDYLDLPSLNDGTSAITWSDAYKNLRIVIGGFNTYKGMGSAENTKNHIVFVFDNCPITKAMKTTNDNAGGYASSDVLKPYLEGGFLTGLVEALGHDYMYAVQRYMSTKSSTAWLTAKIFPPTEIEVYGVQCYGDELGTDTSPRSHTPIQLPIYRDSYTHRIKRYNGSRQWWWLSTPYSASAANFCLVHNVGFTVNSSASSVGGCAPAFCVA
jgi:hypothetical protein